jgi:acyl transferase domain-containing protein
VNSFGYGGTNAHAVLDDAYNYLSARGIIAKHSTVCSSPRLGELFPYKNALPPNLSARESHGNGSNGYSENELPKVFIWSSSEEIGLRRLAATYQEHLLKAHNYRNGYLDSLAYTLSNKRSNLPWKSFFVAKSVSDLQDGLISKLSRPVRSSLQILNLGFIFTGQGAQWYAMGRELVAYPTFRKSLYAAQDYMHMLGSEWSLTGMFLL